MATQTTTVVDSTTTSTNTTTNSTTTGTTTITTTTQTTTQTTETTTEEIYVSLNPGLDTVEINTDWTDAGALLHVGDNQYEMQADGTVDPTTLGLYVITYNFTLDIEYVIQRFVVVEDRTPPIITLNPGIHTFRPTIYTTWPAHQPDDHAH